MPLIVSMIRTNRFWLTWISYYYSFFSAINKNRVNELMDIVWYLLVFLLLFLMEFCDLNEEKLNSLYWEPVIKVCVFFFFFEKHIRILFKAEWQNPSKLNFKKKEILFWNVQINNGMIKIRDDNSNSNRTTN